MRISYKDYLKMRKRLRDELIYIDWFGERCLVDRIDDIVKRFGEPRYIWIQCKKDEECIAIIEYSDMLVFVGYDGLEYEHEFVVRVEGDSV